MTRPIGSRGVGWADIVGSAIGSDGRVQRGGRGVQVSEVRVTRTEAIFRRGEHIDVSPANLHLKRRRETLET